MKKQEVINIIDGLYEAFYSLYEALDMVVFKDDDGRYYNSFIEDAPLPEEVEEAFNKSLKLIKLIGKDKCQ